ncbi:MAG: hypothetical protein U0168_14850 [Nannocystaceae bacterium]
MQVSPTQMGAAGSVHSSELLQPVGPEEEEVPTVVLMVEPVIESVPEPDIVVVGPVVAVVESVVDSLVSVPLPSATSLQSGSSGNDLRWPQGE